MADGEPEHFFAMYCLGERMKELLGRARQKEGQAKLLREQAAETLEEANGARQRAEEIRATIMALGGEAAAAVVIPKQ